MPVFARFPAVVHYHGMLPFGICYVACRDIRVLHRYVVQIINHAVIIFQHVRVGGYHTAKHVEYALLRAHPLLHLTCTAFQFFFHLSPAPAVGGDGVYVHAHDEHQRQRNAYQPLEVPVYRQFFRT